MWLDIATNKGCDKSVGCDLDLVKLTTIWGFEKTTSLEDKPSTIK